MSAKGEESDVVIGLGLGADDYTLSPLVQEMLARVKAVLRRGPLQEEQQKDRIVARDLVIDPGRHEVRAAGELVKLTATEFKLLHQLASNQVAPTTRTAVQSRRRRRCGGRSNIDVHIRSVRKNSAILEK